MLYLLNAKASTPVEEISNKFRDIVFAAREKRFEWLLSAFPSKPVLMRLIKSGTAQVHWLKVKKLGIVEPECPSNDFGRHHFAPRKSWASELGHFDAASRQLTSSGLAFMKLAKWSNDFASAHWISPPEECLEILRVPASSREGLRGAAAPTLDLFRPACEEQPPSKELVQAAADFLIAAFKHIRLFHARQALTSPLRYFLVAYEMRNNIRVDLNSLLQEISRVHTGEFSFLSSRSGALAYYQLRGRSDG